MDEQAAARQNSTRHESEVGPLKKGIKKGTGKVKADAQRREGTTEETHVAGAVPVLVSATERRIGSQGRASPLPVATVLCGA